MGSVLYKILSEIRGQGEPVAQYGHTVQLTEINKLLIHSYLSHINEWVNGDSLSFHMLCLMVLLTPLHCAVIWTRLLYV